MYKIDNEYQMGNKPIKSLPKILCALSKILKNIL